MKNTTEYAVLPCVTSTTTSRAFVGFAGIGLLLGVGVADDSPTLVDMTGGCIVTSDVTTVSTTRVNMAVGENDDTFVVEGRASIAVGENADPSVAVGRG